jgi:hypothetical protein
MSAGLSGSSLLYGDCACSPSGEWEVYSLWIRNEAKATFNSNPFQCRTVLSIPGATFLAAELL